MKILIAPDSFKETLSAEKISTILSNEITYALKATCVTCPLADGGEGSLSLLSSNLGAKLIKVKTLDPLMRKIGAQYAFVESSKTAIVELASASGLHLLEKTKRNPGLASTYGTGLMIKHAIEKGATNVLLTLGGSATNDGGTGIAHALGVVFSNKQGESFLPTGETLSAITSISTKNVLKTHFKIACDVTNPMVGEHGASKVYSPQKGANAAQVAILEDNMNDFARLLEKDYRLNPSSSGLGAAGATSASLASFFETELVSGIELIADLVKLEQKIKEADIVISGEGKFDEQSLQGKVISKVISLCEKHDKELIIVCGSREFDKPLALKHKFFALSDYYSLESCLNQADFILKELINDKLIPFLKRKKR